MAESLILGMLPMIITMGHLALTGVLKRRERRSEGKALVFLHEKDKGRARWEY
jgi:hypothetical protein